MTFENALYLLGGIVAGIVLTLIAVRMANRAAQEQLRLILQENRRGDRDNADWWKEGKDPYDFDSTEWPDLDLDEPRDFH